VAALKPPRLRKGALIGLVSPASTPRPAEKIERGAKYLEALGYRVEVGKHAAREHGFLAGTDAERAEDLNRMIRDPRIDAIFALRGGYGCGRILDQVDYNALRRRPKIVSGFSDITALQLALYRQCRLVTFSGPMPAVEFWKDPDPWTEENFWRLLTDAGDPGELSNPAGTAIQTLHGGTASGVLLGGNLSLVASSVGTRLCPSFRNALLVLEEVDEAPYRVDRMLTQLRNSGVAGRMAGAIFGQFTRCDPLNANSARTTAGEVIADFVAHAGKPAVGGLQHGHVPKKLTVPFGIRARLGADAGKIKLLEAAVA
jgi:muramoyltetrapeptide carboxypeptidase